MTKLCECGCGQPTPVTDRNRKERGYIAGQPQRFVFGHRARLERPDEMYRVVDRGYDTPCWEWQRATNRGGYGTRNTRRKETKLAHRWMYQQAKGEIPDDLPLDHLCRNTVCVNPDHLEPVTHAENLRRGSAAKLVPEQVIEIRRRAANREKHRILAADFGISIHQVRSIIYRNTWKDI